MKDRRTGLFNLASSTSRTWQLLHGREGEGEGEEEEEEEGEGEEEEQ